MIATPIYDQMIAEREGRPPGLLTEEDFTALLLPPAIQLPVEEPVVTEASSLLPAEVARVVLVKAPKAQVDDDDSSPETCLDEELCTRADPCPVCEDRKKVPDPEETQEMKLPEKAAQAPEKVSEKKVSPPAAGRVRTRTRTGVVNGKK